MASAAPAPVVDALIVGKSFVGQYYHILCNGPEHLHRFYLDISTIGRVGQDGVMRDFSTLQGISEELKTLTNGDILSAEITSYDTQASHYGGFVLSVTGYFTLKETLKKKFAQTFFLAPQENGYFVLNDILRFDNEPETIDGEVVPVIDVPRPSAVCASTGNNGSEQAGYVSVDPVRNEVSKPLNNEHDKENILVPEIVNEEVPDIEITRKEGVDDSLKNYDPADGIEYVPKKSYASVLKVVKGKSGVSTESLPSPKQIPKDKEHQASSDPSLKQIIKEQGQQASSDPSPVIETEAVSEIVDAAENGHDEGFEAVAEGASIYVRHLPANATIDMLETEFKQFGAIGNGGIQVIIQRGYVGFPYGFVEFEEAEAAQRAIEASPVIIGGQRAFVEEKRSTARGRGNVNVNGYGNRNVGVRGRGSYGYGYNNRRGGGRSFNHRRGNEYVAGINTY